ncbi:MAG: coenzyme F420-0:L-glutamate ligase [Candidatus Thorarchaeota archaeon]|jgi:coenzyme F420-0:L-glutamate ligase/coenzyme F420-1:gamma-L-glutamate ligase
MNKLFRRINIENKSGIMTPKTISAIALSSIPIIKPGDSLAEMILKSVEGTGIDLSSGNVFVIASKIISKAEGRLVKASDVKVSDRASEIAEKNGFDPIHVELALRESVEVIRSDGVLITETNSGLICNFSGVDKSNAPGEEYILLPKDPDQSARGILEGLVRETGLNLAVVISDTQGRPWRKGSINVAIGSAGINAFKHNKGKRDLHGRLLKRSSVCQIDELASLAEPLMGQAGEKIPAVIIRDYEYEDGMETGSDIIRPKDEDLFR